MKDPRNEAVLSVDEMVKTSVTMKASGLYFPAVMFAFQYLAKRMVFFQY